MKNVFPAVLLVLFLLGNYSISSGNESGEDQAGLEAAFIAMLKDATLEGTWVPIQGGKSGDQKVDSYQVVRAEKVEGDQWHIVSRMKHQGQEIEFPIPVKVIWAGDTAVMILDEVATGGGKSYSARVLFHNDRYAGSWWGSGQPGGLLSGTISRK